MKKVAIVGFGRFGKTLYEIIKKDFEEIKLFDKSKKTFKNYSIQKNTKIIYNSENIYEKNDNCFQTIFFCVPISNFEKTIHNHQKFFQKNHILIDVLSVKLFPKKIFNKYLSKNIQAILTHPMFGPDSYKKENTSKLPLVMDKFKAKNKIYNFWKTYFFDKKFKVIEMQAKQHDKQAAFSQGITHFIGRLLEDIDMKKTKIDTLGAQKLIEIKEQTCNDTWQLFEDLQTKNPYTKQMRLILGKSYNKLYKKLLPKQVNKNYLIFGIQGGKGSFNEQALIYYTKQNKIKNFKIKYLYTTKKVLQELFKGNIDFGQFAIQNSIGGVVKESIEAMAQFQFQIKEEFAIQIKHFLMKHKKSKLSDIDTFMSHPQVLKQCKSTLEQKYPKIHLCSGKNDLIDHANLAKYMAKDKLDKNIAIIGPQILAKIYNLDIIDKNLQDDKKNYTSFLIVHQK